MLNRVGATSDNLGVWEGINDNAIDGKGVNVTAKFSLAFTSKRQDAYRKIQSRHLKNMNSPQDYFSRTIASQVKKDDATEAIIVKQMKQKLDNFRKYIQENQIVDL